MSMKEFIDPFMGEPVKGGKKEKPFMGAYIPRLLGGL